jgi:hypothetical protein
MEVLEKNLDDGVHHTAVSGGHGGEPGFHLRHDVLVRRRPRGRRRPRLLARLLALIAQVLSSHVVRRAADDRVYPRHHVGLAQEIGHQNEVGHQDDLRECGESHGSVWPLAHLDLLARYASPCALGPENEGLQLVEYVEVHSESAAHQYQNAK